MSGGGNARHRLRLVSLLPQAAPGARLSVSIARAFQLEAREARRVLASLPFTVPLELSEGEAEALGKSLLDIGVKTERLFTGRTGERCSLHQHLAADEACHLCGRRQCTLCGLLRPDKTCSSCARRIQRARSFRQIRIGALLVAGLGVCLWGLGRRQSLQTRNAWGRTLEIGVVLVAPKPMTADLRESLGGGLRSLEKLFASELARYRGGPVPFHFKPYGPVVAAALPSLPGRVDGLWARAKEAYALRGFIHRLKGEAQVEAGTDVLLVLELQPKGATSVEGAGEEGGDFGVVRVPSDDIASALSLTAVGHELLHCFGATDKYDVKGHALIPQGLAEPELVPIYPQHFTEIMVGERPVSEMTGQVPALLDEVRVGPLTAREIGWQ